MHLLAPIKNMKDNTRLLRIGGWGDGDEEKEWWRERRRGGEGEGERGKERRGPTSYDHKTTSPFHKQTVTGQEPLVISRKPTTAVG